MGVDYLLNEKFIAAKLPDICAPRHALLNLFFKNSHKRFLFVSAPAGYGKIVSTLLWLEASGRKTVWIGLDSYDDSPSIFYKLFCTGILSMQPENKAMADVVKNPAFSGSPVEHTIAVLSELLLDDRTLYALVLDDMHFIENEEILKSLPFVLKRLPLSFVTLILTRDETMENLDNFTTDDKAARVTAAELTFSDDEIRKYFGSYGHFITAEEAAAVRAVTNGWAIGVNALAISGQMTFGQKSNQILDGYIKMHIWDKWDEDLKEFLLRTSVADEMDVELAIRLTGRKDSGDVLDRLCKTNTFVGRLSSDTFRYHHLFLDFLRNIYHSQERQDEAALYKIVSSYYFEKGEYYDAARYAIKGDDCDGVASAVFELQGCIVGSAVAVHISKMNLCVLSNMPDKYLDKAPYLLTSYAWYYYLMGDAARFTAYLDRLYDKLPEITENHKQFLVFTLLVATLDFRTSMPEKLAALENEINSETAKQFLQSTSLTLDLPFLHRSHRDYSHYAADIEKNMCDYEKSLSHMQDYHYIEKAMRSGLYYEKNMLKESVFYAEQAAALIPSVASALMLTVGVSQAALLYALGQTQAGERKLADVEQSIVSDNAQYMLPNFLAYKTKMRLIDGDKHSAKAWLENYFVTETEHLELYKVFQYFTTARAYIVLGQTEKAFYYINRLKKLGEDFCRPLDIAEASCLQAVLEWALGNKKEARETLETAMTATQDYGLVRVFAQEGASILPILKKISARMERDGYNGSMNPLYVHDVTLAAYEQSKRHKGIAVHINFKPVKLSKQQKLILTLLSKGHKYTEIMQITGLTIHTVKSHALAVYRKLDVNNSMDATLKARGLGLIE